jgi:hypothetical protein
MSAAEDRQREMQPDMVTERLAVAEELLKNKKVKLPDVVLANAVDDLRKIKEKLEKRLPVHESDFDFVEELKYAIKIVQQYDGAMENLKGGDLYNPEKPIKGDIKAPTKEEVIHTLQAKLTKEQKEVIAQMKNPVLLVKPITTWIRFAENLNSAGQIGFNSRESEWTENEKDAEITNKITGWEVGFVEGKQELDGKPGILGDLITEWQNSPTAKKGAKLITNNEYMLLIAQSIKKESPTDEVNWPILRGEGRENIIGKDWRVSLSRWNDGVPYFNDYNPKLHCDFARFRAVVMVKI